MIVYVSHKKEIKRLVAQAESQGWRVEPTRGGHLKWMPPDRSQSFVISAATPSDHRALKNIISHLRQRGFDPNG